MHATPLPSVGSLGSPLFSRAPVVWFPFTLNGTNATPSFFVLVFVGVVEGSPENVGVLGLLEAVGLPRVEVGYISIPSPWVRCPQAMRHLQYCLLNLRVTLQGVAWLVLGYLPVINFPPVLGHVD